MDDVRPDIDAIFAAAIELGSPTERAAYIASACAGNEPFRLRVEELIDAYFRAGEFLELPATPSPTLAWSIVSETPGTKIGRYKLLEQIGEGGFGVVFMADQEEPVPPTRRAENHQVGNGHEASGGPFRGRAAGSSDDGPSEHRQSARCGRD